MYQAPRRERTEGGRAVSSLQDKGGDKAREALVLEGRAGESGGLERPRGLGWGSLIRVLTACSFFFAALANSDRSRLGTRGGDRRERQSER